MVRTRVGLTAREARPKLVGHCYEYRTSSQAHSTEVLLAYDRFEDNQWENMALETFTTILGHPAIQRHLLAARPQTIEEVVWMGNKYLQVFARLTCPVVAMCDNEDSKDTDSETGAVASAEFDQLAKNLDKMTETLPRLEQ